MFRPTPSRAARRLSCVALLAPLAGACVDTAPERAARAAGAPTAPSLARAGTPPFELWVVDQSNTDGLAFGGTIHVYDGTDLMGEAASRARPVARLDLGGAAAALCRARTNANPVRPHMLAFNATR